MYMMLWKLAFWKQNQMLILLQSKGRLKFHINKVCKVHYIYCNGQVCVGYSKDILMVHPS